MARDYFAEEIEGKTPVKRDYFAEELGEKTPAKLQAGRTNILGDITGTRGTAATTAALQTMARGGGLKEMATSYAQGANIPENVPSMQDVVLNRYYEDLANLASKIPNQGLRSAAMGAGTALGNVPSAGGAISDIAINAANSPLSLLALASKIPIAAGKTLGQVAAATRPAQAVSRFANMPVQETLPGRVVKQTFDTIKNIPNFPKESISKIRDYAGNKILAVRGGAKKYWGQEIKIYGDSVDKLAGNSDIVSSGGLLESMTKTLVDRKLYDQINNKWVQPLNKVDSQFVKSYSNLFRKSAQTGKLKIGDIVKEYQAIRDSVPIDTPLGRDARIIANSLIDGIKNLINVEDFKNANKRYADFRNNFDAIDKVVDVWGNPKLTGRGEKFLTRRLGETKEAREIAKIITSKTGQTLKAAKILSAIRNLPAAKWLIR